MKIYIRKDSAYRCEYQLQVERQNTVIADLDVKTYLIHDITHFIVEQSLNCADGFWGMLAQGYSFKQLSGKENELTPTLRYVEKIVGPVQSVFMGFIITNDFETYTSHLDANIDIQWLNKCIEAIKNIYNDWDKLKVGEQLLLVWPMHN